MNATELVRHAQDVALKTGIDPWRALMRALVMQLRELDLPSELEPAFTIAEAYWGADRGAEGDLMRAKELAWAYIQSFPSGGDLATRSGRLARAALCVLEPVGDDETISLTAEWFVSMVGESSSGGALDSSR